jgi:hypothetical protein
MGLGYAAPAAVAALVGILGSLPHVSARVVTGQSPCEAALWARAVWVANDGAGTLVRINPRNNKITARIRLGRGACTVAAGAAAL